MKAWFCKSRRSVFSVCRPWLALVLVGVWVAAVPAWGGTYERTLDNGLKVIVREDHRAPVAVSQVWYRVGSMDEYNGTTGISHVLEHMMFKGTRTVPAGQFSSRIAAAGGRENAFTARDYTAYFQTLGRDRLPLAFKLEADRMHNLVLKQEDFAKEIRVVQEERRWRTDDQPQSLVYETLMATAFKEHPYRRPVIGWMNDLEHLNVGDVRRWYHRWYAPNNAILVVVGDVSHGDVFRLAQRYFGKVPAERLPERKPQAEPPQRGIKRVTVKAPAELPYLLMGYHAPVLRNASTDWEPYALEILAGVLDGSGSARLNRSLVRESRIASSVGAGYDGVARGPGMFLFDGTPSEGKSVADLEGAIRAEIVKIQQDGITDGELQRVKAQVIAAQVYQRDSMFYQAMLIGQYEATGFSYKALDERLAKLEAVTADQVRAVAAKYLVDDNLTVATLDPQPLPAGKPRSAPPAGHEMLR